MSEVREIIIIGPIFVGQVESVSIVNQAFISGLQHRCEFVPHFVIRPASQEHGARFTFENLFYFWRQFLQWAVRLFRHRPAVAQYAVGSGWNMEKSLAFLTLARLFGVRSLGHLHGGDFLRFNRQLGSLRRRWALFALRRLDGLAVLSEAWKQSVVAQFGLDPSRVHVVNNPIGPEFEVAALSIPVPRSAPVILGLGLMERAKGVFELLEAMVALRRSGPVQLLLVGPEREPGVLAAVRQKIQELGLQDCVELQGAVHGPAKLELFRRASILVLPSHVENFPLVILEAAAAGLGIVSTPVGATPEFFQDQESILLTPVGDAPALATALQDLLLHEDKRQRLGAAARQTFLSRLSRDRVMQSMLDAYQAVLTRPRSS